MLIVTAGLPGSGKSTIAEVVANRLGLVLLSVDPIEAAILAAGIDPDQPTGLAAYLVAEKMAEAALTTGRGVIIDAVNAVEPAREQWMRLAAEQNTPIRFVEVVCSDPDLHRERLASRQHRLAHLAGSESHAVEQSLDEWEPWGVATGSVPRTTIDSARPLGVNVEQALKFLDIAPAG
ncbi:AAA family ATPase [soil metagenome]